MPITISYDLIDMNTNDRTYIRSMLERFGWKRLGGSVFRYDGSNQQNAQGEDWLNDVVPALMFMRSYIVARNGTLRFFTVDTHSSSTIDHSDHTILYGRQPTENLQFTIPTNSQSSEKTLREFVSSAVDILR